MQHGLPSRRQGILEASTLNNRLVAEPNCFGTRRHYLDCDLVRPRYEIVYCTAHVIKGTECCRVHRVRRCVLEHVEAAGTLIQRPGKLPIQYHLHMTTEAGLMDERSPLCMSPQASRSKTGPCKRPIWSMYCVAVTCGKWPIMYRMTQQMSYHEHWMRS